jgi:hypothetical protein
LGETGARAGAKGSVDEETVSEREEHRRRLGEIDRYV